MNKSRDSIDLSSLARYEPGKEAFEMDVVEAGRYVRFSAVEALIQLARCSTSGSDDWISDAIRDVAELPDRDSPPDASDMMLVTADELREIVERHAPAAHTQKEAAPALWYNPAGVERERLTDYADQIIITGASVKFGYYTTPLYAAPTTVPDHSEREAANAGGLDDDDLESALVLFDMGLGFALCHRDFGATREALKKLQADFKTLRNLVAQERAPATIAAGQEAANAGAWKPVMAGLINELEATYKALGQDGPMPVVSIGQFRRLSTAKAFLCDAAANAKDAARLKALHAAVSALYFDDSSDFRSALGAVIRHLDRELAGEMLGSPKAAYDKVCAAMAAVGAAGQEGGGK